MRKVLFLLLLTLGWSEVEAQTGHSCAPFDQGRTLSGMKEILMRDGLYYDNLRLSYADAINTAVGKNIIKPTKEGMSYVLENTKFLDETFIVPSDYFNGVRYGDSISFTTLAGQPSDSWAVFTYENVDYVYAKVSCMNPQKQKIKKPIFPKGREEVSLPKGESKITFRTPAPREEKLLLNLSLPKQELKKKRKLWPWLVGVGVASVTATIIAVSNNGSSSSDGSPAPSPGHDGGGGPAPSPGH